MSEDFAAFILTHGRPHKVVTFGTLRKQGYTGDIYIIVDNEDKTVEEYRKVYGDKVIMFNKAAVARTFDEGDNFTDRRAVVYARNACFDIARNLGITYFLQLDDDYIRFHYRFDGQRRAIASPVRNLDRLFDIVLEFYKASSAKAIALLQGGDMIGGKNGGYSKSIRTYRKCMNTFLCSTERSFQFVGRINEDVNTYVWYQSLGNLFLSINSATITQVTTQHSEGGMSGLYLDSGTYVKSFYTVMYAPSCVKIGHMGDTHHRLHHAIRWADAVPCIVAEKHSKARQDSPNNYGMVLTKAGVPVERVGGTGG